MPPAQQESNARAGRSDAGQLSILS